MKCQNTLTITLPEDGPSALHLVGIPPLTKDVKHPLIWMCFIVSPGAGTCMGRLSTGGEQGAEKRQRFIKLWSDGLHSPQGASPGLAFPLRLNKIIF